MHKFEIGDKVSFFGSEAEVVDFHNGVYVLTDDSEGFRTAFESELTLLPLEDDRGKNRTFDEQDYYDSEA